MCIFLPFLDWDWRATYVTVFDNTSFRPGLAFFFFSKFLLMFIFISEKERERAHAGEGQRERETQSRLQALSCLSVQSPTQG